MPSLFPRSLAARLEALPATLRGTLWMLGAVLNFAVMINLVRYLSETQHTLEIVFFRNLMGVLAMAPWLLRTRFAGLRTERLPLHMLRAFFGLMAMIFWFTTLALALLAEATALSFLAPMFISILAVLVLGETMHARRWAAIAAAFLGALVILRPGLEAVQPAALIALVTALFWAAGSITVKILARTESSAAIAVYMVLPLTPISLIAAIPVWRTPTLAELIAFIALGAVGTMGHVSLARALTIADAGHVAPFDYLRLPAVAAIAYLAFGETADLWTWAGAGIIAASGIYLAHRESAARRRAAAAADEG